MTQPLTREQIEEWRTYFMRKCDLTQPGLDSVNALCDAALVGIAVQPRPIDKLVKWPCADTDIVKRLRHAARTRNGVTYGGAGDGVTTIMGYYDSSCAKRDDEAADFIEAQAAEITALRAQLVTARDDALEEAACIIANNCETVSSAENVRSLKPRMMGDLLGTAYVTAIRALQPDAGEFVLVPVNREFICEKCGIRQETGEKHEPTF
jgi:hypothetical protein